MNSRAKLIFPWDNIDNMRKVLRTILLLVVTFLVGGVAALVLLNASEQPVVESRTPVEVSFEEIAELSVEEYHFTNVGKHEHAARQFLGQNVPLTGSSFLLTYSGSVKGGVRDFGQIDVDIDDVTETITIDIPAVEITESKIDPDSITVWDQSMNPFKQVQVQDFADFLASETTVAEDQAIQSGLLERAEDRVEALMVAHVESLSEGTQQEGYTVTVSWKGKS